MITGRVFQTSLTIVLVVFLGFFLVLETNQSFAQDNPKVSVEDLENYLQSINTLQSDFTQANADGTRSLGKLFLQRPNKLRIFYLPPDTGIIIARGGSIAFFDTNSNTSPRIAPLNATPIATILGDKIDLKDPDKLIEHVVGDIFNELHISLQGNFFKGTVVIQFLNEPITLVGWVYVDEFGNQTSIQLTNPEWGLEFNQRIFNIEFQKEQLGLE